MIEPALLQAFSTEICKGDGVACFQREAMAFLRRAFSSSAACFLLYLPGGESIDRSFFALSDLSPDTASLYCQHYAAIDPIAGRISRYLAPGAGAGAARSQDVLPSGRVLLESPFYTEFMRPRRLHHVLSVRLALGGRALGRLNLYRPREEAAFSAEEAAGASLLAPLVSIGLQHARQSDLSQVQERVIGELALTVPRRGIAVLDGSFRATYVSGEAPRYLEGMMPARPGRGAHGSSLPPAVAARCRVLARSERFGCRGQDFTLLRTPQGELLTLTLVRLATPTPAMRYFLDLRPHAGPDTQSAAFGLSRREDEVARMVASGLDSAEISDKLCISRHTVNNHLRSIYAKMGVSSRTRMIAKLLQDGAA
jgi:DNA-binding CsgD family transcriptional regulator